MSEQIQISGKDLGAIGLPGFCERCFWISRKTSLPYQWFPGIFSSIDAYSKRVVHGCFDEHGRQPSWLDPLGSFKGYLNPPSYHTFNTIIQQYNIKLTGSADGILVRDDGAHVIIDYKTAKYTATQDELMPMYEIQLNTYALIAERVGISPVSGLALIYFEPITHDDAAVDHENIRGNGFAMGFSAHIHQVEINTAGLTPLFHTCRQIFDLNQAPPLNPECEDCQKLQEVVNLIDG
jgi:hypothetical protein